MKRLLAAGLLLCSLSAQAAIDTYEFETEAERERYRVLIAELRCPKCQNQNLADSNAPIAMDLRREVYRMLEEGQSDEQIVDYLVDRYGDFVRYRPPVDERTWLLWFGPAAMLGGGLLLVGAIVLRRRRPALPQGDAAAANADSASGSLTAEERERLDQLLNRKGE